MNNRMRQYLIQRFISLIAVVFAVALITFFAIRLVPGDPAILLAGPDASDDEIEAVRDDLGLNEPWPAQFAIFVSNTVQGDFGKSLRTRRPVLNELADRIPNSLALAGLSIIVATIVGLPLGVLAAVNRGRLIDSLAMGFSTLGICMPTFWLGLLLITFFAARLKWLPSAGFEGPKYLVLPVATLAFYSLANIARITRTSMLDVLRQDYVRTARSKGLAESTVVQRHALKNALIPIITIIGVQFGYLLGAAVVTETVFAWPGIGQYLILALQTRDYPVVQSTVVIIGVLFAVINLIADLLYAVVDPRV